MRLALLDEVRRAVGFDWFAWLLTDPETEVGSAPLTATPTVSDLPRLVRLKYLATVNRWTGLGAPVAFLGGQFGDQDGDFLSAIAGPITEALRRCQARTFELAEPDLDRTGPVVFVLSPELQLKAQTPETEEYLRRRVPPDARRQELSANPRGLSNS